jgi:hypothetical protein
VASLRGRRDRGRGGAGARHGASVGWRSWQEGRREAEADRFTQAVAGVERDPAAAADKLAGFAGEAGTGYGAIARLREAEARAAANDGPGAVAALQALAGDGSVDPLFRDLGAILAATREVDGADPAALKARLEPLAAAGQPFRYTARELLAMLALKAGDVEGARRALAELRREAGLPEAQERRVGELLAALGGEPEAATPATAAATPPPAAAKP